MRPIHSTFIAGTDGDWRINSVKTVSGEIELPPATRLNVIDGLILPASPGASWSLTGTTSNTRYATRREVDSLSDAQEGLGRAHATCAALIPIRKTIAWWGLAQDERRTILEHESKHIETGMRYLPAIARRLYHSRELRGPFDFLTWFEFAPADSAAFEELVRALRATREWHFVDAEVDIRLSKV